jgi:hypothetical protein
MVGVSNSSTTATIIKDGDLNMGAYAVKSNDVNEVTPAHGVDVDGAKIKDGQMMQGGVKKEASDNLRHSHDAESGTFSTGTYVKQKTMTFANGIQGTLRVKFALWSNSGIQEAFGAVYKNGALIGTPQHHSDSGTYNTYSEDIDVGVIAAGETLELWGKVETANDGKVKEFRAYYNNTPLVAGVTNS